MTDYDYAVEAAEYYNNCEAGVDEDTLTPLSPEADRLLGLALEAGLCSFLNPDDILECVS